MARFYRNTDAGSPTLTWPTTVNTSNPVRFNNFKLVLKAALVSGYGAVPGAGWTFINETEWTLTLRNSTGRYFTISCLAPLIAEASRFWHHDCFFRIFLHNTFTGVVNNIPQGEGVVSGTAPGGSTPHWGGNYYWGGYGHLNTALWTVLADSKSFFLCQFGSPYTAYTNGNIINDTLDSNTSTPWASTLYLGDDDRDNFIAVGGQLLAVPSGYPANPSFDYQAITTLFNPNTGLLIDTGGAPAVTQVVSLFAIGPSTGTTSYARDWFSLCPVEWTCGSKVVGALRGIFFDLVTAHANARSRYQGLFENVSPFRADLWLAPKRLADGYDYMLVPTPRNTRGTLISNNPALW